MIDVSMRRRVEKAILKLAVKLLAEAGWKVVNVWDGEEYVPATTADEAWEAASAVDEATVHFENAAGRDQGVLFVWGNDGIDAISDYHIGAQDFSDAMDRINAIVESADIEFIEAKAEGK